MTDWGDVNTTGEENASTAKQLPTGIVFDDWLI
jgi:hypothetical protein